MNRATFLKTLTFGLFSAPALIKAKVEEKAPEPPLLRKPIKEPTWDEALKGVSPSLFNGTTCTTICGIPQWQGQMMWTGTMSCRPCDVADYCAKVPYEIRRVKDGRFIAKYEPDDD